MSPPSFKPPPIAASAPVMPKPKKKKGMRDREDLLVVSRDQPTRIQPSTSKAPPGPTLPTSTTASLVDMQEDKTNSEEMLKRSRAASTYMDDFFEFLPLLLLYILYSESHPLIGSLCSCNNATRTIMCLDCQFYLPTCAECFVNVHKAMPFHWAEKWNGFFFDKVDITALPVVPPFILTLGHEEWGERCPLANYDNPIRFIITDLNGVHDTKVAFCECHLDLKRWNHCMKSKIFPSMTARPTSGFTFNILRDFHIHTLTSKKSAYDYIEAIRCKTNNMFPQDVPNTYTQFLRVERLWRAISNIKRAGQAHDIDKFFPFRPPRNVTVPCFSCPKPSFNVDVHQHRTDPVTRENFQHLFTLPLMIDGHFGLQKFKKPDDPNDTSIHQGRGFFPSDDIYSKFVSSVVVTSNDKSTCSRFNAVEMQNKLKFKGCVITGVLGVECGRHSVFISMVDLQKGERFANADFALSLALQRYSTAESMQGGNYYQRVLITYDIACQYFVHLKERFKSAAQQFDQFKLDDIMDSITMLVPKMHLAGHKEDCQCRFSLNYTEGTGRMSGEGIESTWGETKQSGGSTQHMTHGNRHDTIIDFHNFWNWLKVRTMCSSLELNLQAAYRMQNEMIESYISLSLLYARRLTELRIKKWLNTSTVPRLVNGEWQSVYRMKLEKLPTQDDILQSFQAHQHSTSTGVDRQNKSNSNRPAVIINAGIKLEKQQRELKQAIRDGGLSSEDLAKRRKALTREVHDWQMIYVKVVPSIEAAFDEAAENNAIEDDPLHLPSGFSLSDRETLGLLDLAMIELKLREGEANEAIMGICNCIRHENLLIAFQKTNSKGVKQNTRSHKIINRVKSNRMEYATTYRNARRNILSLKGITSDDEFPELLPKHMFQKNAAETRRLGEGSETDSWIWSYGRLRGLSKEQHSELVNESEKVHWFRTRADMMRWVEEVEILEEEFRRFIHASENMSKFWNDVQPSESHDTLSGYIVYARQKGAMYARMAKDAATTFTKLGGSWPSANQSLEDHALLRRPNMDIPWDQADIFFNHEENPKSIDTKRTSVTDTLKRKYESSDSES